jgi:hypothetical protein
LIPRIEDESEATSAALPLITGMTSFDLVAVSPPDCLYFFGIEAASFTASVCWLLDVGGAVSSCSRFFAVDVRPRDDDIVVTCVGAPVSVLLAISIEFRNDCELSLVTTGSLFITLSIKREGEDDDEEDDEEDEDDGEMICAGLLPVQSLMFSLTASIGAATKSESS